MASHGLPAQAKATPRPDPLLFHPKATYVGGLASFPGKAFLNTFCDGLWEQRIGRQTFEVHVVTGAKPCGSVVSQRRRGRRHPGASPFYMLNTLRLQVSFAVLSITGVHPPFPKACCPMHTLPGAQPLARLTTTWSACCKARSFFASDSF
jgi:hypothetical protein